MSETKEPPRPNPHHLKILKEGVERWNAWRKDQGRAFKPQLQRAHLYRADLQKADLRSANLQKADLAAAKLQEANLQYANLQKAILTAAKLQRANLFSADLQGASFSSADLQEADLRNADLQKADLRHADLQGADLRDADLQKADLSHAKLQGADLRDANLTNSQLEGAYISGAVLAGVEYDADHRSLHDGSDKVVRDRRDRWLNWSRLRQIGQLPLFGVSYAALLLSIAVVNGTAFVNRWLPVWIDWGTRVLQGAELLPPDLVAPQLPSLPVPARMTEIFVASLCLVVGTTFYRLACPHRVQEFSETQWVEEHGRARLQYYAESFRRKWAQWPTLVFTVVGGLLGGWLVGERLWRALVYVLQQAMP